MRNKFKIPFASRSHSYTKSEIDNVVKVMKEASTLTQGPYLKKFEENFSKFIGSSYCFAVNSATSALELSAQLCQLKKNDEVIIPSHTYTSSAYPFIKTGAKIIWCDIDPKTRVINVNTIKKCITKKTKVIVAPHLYGYCIDMPPIIKLAKQKKILVVEDVAQAIGTSIDNKKAGTFGDFGIFSFHSHKNITTLGEGGMLIVKDKAYADIIPMLRHNGHCEFKYRRDKYWIPAMGNVDLPSLKNENIIPNNFCIGEVECALGIQLLKRVNKINKFKQDRALYFIDSLKQYDQLEFHRVKSRRHNYHLLIALEKSGKRDDFIEKMSNEEKVQCVVQYYPLNRYPLYQKLGFSKANCPNADYFFDNMISFPFQETLSDNQFNRMIDSTLKVLKKIY
jgi:dTDP-4-amino-4,6-dideoxygalactose transaminase